MYLSVIGVHVHPPKRRSRRRRLLTRALPLALVAAASFALGIYVSGASNGAQRRVIDRYTQAWAHGDYRTMYSLLSPASRHKTTELEFAAELQSAAETATTESLRPLHGGSINGSLVTVPFEIQTHVFGTLHEPLQLSIVGSGGGTRVTFSTALLFPGLRSGELLSRHTRLGRRGNLLAADGTPLAKGRHLTSPIPQVADQIVGTVGPIPASQATHYADLGYPANAKVGVDGLEAIFQKRLAGRLGGRLLAGTRVLATSRPGRGQTVRTTIVPQLEQDVTAALGGSYAGMTLMNPRNGAVLAAVGLAFGTPQPPGSTFKIITASAALKYHVAELTTQFPYQRSVVLDGFKLENAAKELCGGTLLEAFAQSCDTVFAPLGAQIGAQHLVGMAQRFGFNHRSGNAAVATSTLPSAATIGGPLAVGSSAIGQGKVQATPLEIADVAATIADGGRRPLPTFLDHAKPRFVRVISRSVAAQVQQMMEAVVSSGTGTSAQIPGVAVAGKTGTAELSNTAGKKNDKQATDAWFVGYAPAGKPGTAKFVGCALFPNNGYGSESAAPAVRSVLQSALGLG